MNCFFAAAKIAVLLLNVQKTIGNTDQDAQTALCYRLQAMRMKNLFVYCPDDFISVHCACLYGKKVKQNTLHEVQF